MYITESAALGLGYQSSDPWFEPYQVSGTQGSLSWNDWAHVSGTSGSAWVNGSELKTYDFASFYDVLSKDINGTDFHLSLAYGYGNLWIVGNSTIYGSQSSFGGLNDLNFLDYDVTTVFGETSNSGGTATTIRNAADVVSFTASGATVTLQSTKVGSDIAYYFSNSEIFLQSAKYLRPLANGAAGVSIIADVTLSFTGQQSWTETGINTGVTVSAMFLAGPSGLALLVGYNFGKEGMEMIQDGLNEGILLPNPDPTSNYIPGLAPVFVIPNW